MEGKKKSSRPTWAMVRELEGKCETLETDNARLKKLLSEAGETITSMDAEIKSLCCRGFWARVFNL